MDNSVLPRALAFAFLIALFSVASRRLGTPSSIFMVVAGVAIAYVPGMPRAGVDSDVVLLLLLPPLLYSSGVGMSWRGFRSNLRAILLLAIGCVLFTTAAVAAVVHYALGVSWAVGFVLGSIVSPPDAVAPMAIARRLGLPRRLLTVLEGESLVNDATALVAFSFAVAAVQSGVFSPADAAVRFTAIVIGEAAYGALLGRAMLSLRHTANDPRAEVLLALSTPFIAFWPPHALGGSGVIACVAAGLWVSWNGRTLIRPATRLQGYFIWDLVTWVVEAMIFLLTGFAAPAVAGGLSGAAWTRLLAAGALVTLTVVVVRFVWVFPATYLPRLLSPALLKRDPYPNWRVPFLIGFTGLRGAVSLAAALSIPLTLGGRGFPERDLVLFATFCVILATLVGQGSALPWVIRRLGLGRAGREEAATNRRAERTARVEGVDAMLHALDQAAATETPQAVVAALRRRHADRRAHFASKEQSGGPGDPLAQAAALELSLVIAERTAVMRAYAENRITDEARRRVERELDLEEARVRHLLEGAGTPDNGAT